MDNKLSRTVNPPCCSATMCSSSCKNRLRPGLPGFGVPALAGGAIALSSALKFFEAIIFASARRLKAGTPNLEVNRNRAN